MSIGLTNSLGGIGINQYLSTQALSSGKKLNSAADNPAGMAESVSFMVQLSGAAQAMSNAQNSASMLNTAQGGVSQVANDLQSVNTLSVQAGDGALNAVDKRAIQSQINQSLQDINQTSQNAQFNGQNLLNGNQGLSSQSGPNVGNTQAIPSTNLTGSALGVNGIDVTSKSGQASALSSLKNALDQVSSAGANLGASQTGLNIAQSIQGTAHSNLSASNASLSDTNYASATSTLAQSNIRQQATTYAINMYNSTQKSVLSLLS